MRSTQDALQDTRERLAASDRRVSKAHSAQRDESQRAQELTEQLTSQSELLKKLEDKFLVAEQQVEDLRAEKEIILKDHTDSSAAHDGALTALRTELEALKRSKAVAQGSLEASKSATEEQLDTLRTSHAAIELSLRQANAELTTKDDALQQASAHAATLSQRYAVLQSEFTDYKSKATQVLQMKEKSISELRTNGGPSRSGEDSLCKQEDTVQLQQDLGAAVALVDQLRADLRDMEQQQDEDSAMAATQIRELEKALRVVKSAKEASEQESELRVKQLTDELEEVHRQRQLLSQEAKRGADELLDLQGEVARLSQTTHGRATAELEEKLRALTGNVVRKQSQIEALSAEKTSLALQVEELERQKRHETIVKIPRSSSRRHDDELSGEGGRVRTLKAILGSDGGTVGHAVNYLDAFSIRIGIFLRRYPAARLMVILYMILLHLWVMVVLFTYTPEMHTGLNDHGLHDGHPVPPDHVDKITYGRG